MSRLIRIRQLLRSTQAMIRQEGPTRTAERMARWVAGERGYFDYPNPVSASPRVDASTPDELRPVLSVGDAAVVTTVQTARRPKVPQVSVIIPVFNALDYTRKCVESLFTVQTAVHFELILIDNGSRPDVAEWMAAELGPETVRGAATTIIHSTANRGYGGGMNLGARLARGEYLVLSNSDVEFTDGWLERLLAHMQADPTIGVLSPLTNYVGEGLQNDPDAADLKPEAAPAYGAKIAAREGCLYPAERLAYFCVMMRASVYDMLNGFDEGFGLGNLEDDNLSVRLRLLGYRLAIARNTFVYHHGSKTFKTNRLDHAQLMERNTYRHLNLLSEFSTAFNPIQMIPRIRAPKPAISVVIRTRNRPLKLRNALLSLANQTQRDFEVVVVNDGGEDVADVLSPFEAQYPIRYVRHEQHLDAGSTATTGLNAAQGEWLCFLDDDDIVYPFHLELLYQTALAQPDYRFFYTHFNRVLMLERGPHLVTHSRLRSEPQPFDRDKFLWTNYIVVHAWLFHRVVHETIGPLNPELFVLQDWDYLIRASRKFDFYGIPRESCEYRFYPSLSNSVLGRRKRSAEEHERIYQMHPTDDPALLRIREEQVQAVRAQVKRFERIEADVQAGRITNAQGHAMMVRDAVGFQLDPADV